MNVKRGFACNLTRTEAQRKDIHTLFSNFKFDRFIECCTWLNHLNCRQHWLLQSLESLSAHRCIGDAKFLHNTFNSRRLGWPPSDAATAIHSQSNCDRTATQTGTHAIDNDFNNKPIKSHELVHRQHVARSQFEHSSVWHRQRCKGSIQIGKLLSRARLWFTEYLLWIHVIIINVHCER